MCSLGRHGALTSIYDLDVDTLAEILRRLPFLNLVRCKSVSKLWYNSISNITISSPTPVLGLLFDVSYDFKIIEERGQWSFACIKGYDERKSTTLVQSCIYTLPFNPSPQNLLDCFNGLLLFSHPSAMLYCVCNPCTQQHQLFPRPPQEDQLPTCSNLILHPNAEYAVVSICRSRESPTLVTLNTFSPASCQWSVHRVVVEAPMFSAPWYAHRVFFDGSLFLLSATNHVLKFGIFDIGFQAIQLPELVFVNEEQGCLGVSQGSLHYSWRNHQCAKELYVWKLQVGSSCGHYEWVLKHTIGLRYFSSHPLCNDMHIRTVFSVLAFHPTSNMLFVGNSGGIFSYDLGTNRLEKICKLAENEEIYGMQECVYPFSPNLSMLDGKSGGRKHSKRFISDSENGF